MKINYSTFNQLWLIQIGSYLTSHHQTTLTSWKDGPRHRFHPYEFRPESLVEHTICVFEKGPVPLQYLVGYEYTRLAQPDHQARFFRYGDKFPVTPCFSVSSRGKRLDQRADFCRQRDYRDDLLLTFNLAIHKIYPNKLRGHLQRPIFSFCHS